MKVVIIGGVAGGASTAARLRRVDENAQIIMFERGPYVSFANCGLPYHLSGIIPEREQLLVTTARDLKETLNIDARPNSEVVAINRAEKTVSVRETLTGREYTESYDKLVLAPGASPIVPLLPGVDLPGVFILHNIPELDAIMSYISKNSPKDVVVVGGGFIGLEVAENLAETGMRVTVVEMLPQVMAVVDPDIAAMVHKHLALHNVGLELGDGLKAISSPSQNGSTPSKTVTLASGKTLHADMVVLAIGVKPETSLAKAADLLLGPRGHIATNEYMQTSDPDIYAVGDAVQVKHRITGQDTALALAGPASKQGRVAADHIAGRKDLTFKGVIGTSVVKVFDLTVASVGLNSRALEQVGLPFDSVTTHNNNHAGYYPGASMLTLKLLYSPEGKIYGAQAVGVDGVEKRIDVVATAITGGLTVYDLEDLELSYAPPYGSSRDPLNIAAFQAANNLRGDMPIKHYEELETLDPAEWFFLDVRHPEELAVGQVPGAINIPLDELRARVGELPRDKKLVVNCAGGQRSYYAVRALRQMGFDAYNLTGGYRTYSCAKEPSNIDPMVPTLCDEPKSESKMTPVTLQEREYTLDACGLQCPGPILKLYNQVKEMAHGDVVTVKATDMGFASDVGAWARSTGNTLLDLDVKGGVVTARVQKGQPGNLGSIKQAVESQVVATQTVQKDLTMVVFSGDLDKAIAALIIANGFAALGQKATLFFTFWGLNILRKDNPPKVKKNLIEKMFGFMMPRGAKKLTLSQMHMMGMGTGMIKGIMKQKNVDSLPEMLRQAQANGVKLLACQMSMDLMGIKQEELLDGVEVAGVATMAVSATESNTHYFI
ncbi:MAG: FAD-dependent oxidoreductase [Anaerolineaceae bacterium]